VTCTYLRQWKNIRKKGQFLVAKSSGSWLEAALENAAKGQDLLREIDSVRQIQAAHQIDKWQKNRKEGA
jgi:hypothetical protein